MSRGSHLLGIVIQYALGLTLPRKNGSRGIHTDPEVPVPTLQSYLSRIDASAVLAGVLTILEAWNYCADNVIHTHQPAAWKEDTVSHQLLAGVDIGGTKTAVTISAQPPEILARSEFPTAPAEGPAQAIARIMESVDQLLLTRGVAPGQLHAIGISCGGPLDPVRGLIQEPPNLATWKDIAICSILEERFGVDCFLENDANAGALAEFSFGAGRGAHNVIFLTMGTGIGAGLILNGE